MPILRRSFFSETHSGILLYSVGSFSKRNIKRFEKIQNTVLRYIFKLKGQVSFTEIRKTPV